MQRWINYKRTKETGQTISTELDHAHEELVRENKHYLGCVVKTVLICAKQGIALRGHRETADPENLSQNRGNFLAFLELFAEYDPIVLTRLTDGPDNSKYTHHTIQDDILRSAAALITENIVREINEAGVFLYKLMKQEIYLKLNSCRCACDT